MTTSSDAKFFSNGLDLDWRASTGEHRGGDRDAFGAEFMALMARIISLPLPSIAAINGHAFGAGFMCALCHDKRWMREDRGFACANEVEIGMVIPQPELALFRHKLPMNVFFETVQLARRWTGPAALAAGIVQGTTTLEGLQAAAISEAASLARLGANRKSLWRHESLAIWRKCSDQRSPWPGLYARQSSALRTLSLNANRYRLKGHRRRKCLWCGRFRMTKRQLFRMQHQSWCCLESGLMGVQITTQYGVPQVSKMQAKLMTTARQRK